MTWLITSIQIKPTAYEGPVSYGGQAALGKAGFCRTTSGGRWEKDCKSIWLCSSLFIILLLSSPKMPSSRVLTDSVWAWLTDEPSLLRKEGREQVFPPHKVGFFSSAIFMVWFLVNKDLFLGFLSKVTLDKLAQNSAAWKSTYHLAACVGEAGWAGFPNSGFPTTWRARTGDASEVSDLGRIRFQARLVVVGRIQFLLGCGLSTSCSECCLEATRRCSPRGLLYWGAGFVGACNKDSLLVEWKLLPFVT